MRGLGLSKLAIVVGLLLLFGGQALVSASAGGAEASTRVAYLVLLDQSSSMWFTDPGGRRIAIVKALIDLMPNQDRVQIVEFSSKTEELLLGWVAVDNAQRERIKAQLGGRSLSARDATDINAALVRGLELIAELEPGLRSVVLLISDGRNTTGSDKPLLDTLTSYANRGIPIYTFGLGIFQPALLKTISDRAGAGGEYLNASGPWGKVERALEAIVAQYSPSQPPEGAEGARRIIPPEEVTGKIQVQVEVVPQQLRADEEGLLKVKLSITGKPLALGEGQEVDGWRVRVDRLQAEIDRDGLIYPAVYDSKQRLYFVKLAPLKPGLHQVSLVLRGQLLAPKSEPSRIEPFQVQVKREITVQEKVPSFDLEKLGREIALRFICPAAVRQGDPLDLKAIVRYGEQLLGPQVQIEIHPQSGTGGSGQTPEVVVKDLHVKVTIVGPLIDRAKPKNETGEQPITLTLGYTASSGAYHAQAESKALAPGRYLARAVAQGILHSNDGSPQEAQFETGSPQKILVVEALPLVGLRLRAQVEGPTESSPQTFTRNERIVIQLIGLNGVRGGPPAKVEARAQAKIEGPTSSSTLVLRNGEAIFQAAQEGEYKVTLLAGKGYRIGPESTRSFRVIPPKLNLELRPQGSILRKDTPLKLTMRSTLYPPDVARLKIEIPAKGPGPTAPIISEPQETTLSPEHPEAVIELRRGGVAFTPWERLRRKERTLKVSVIDVDGIYPWEAREITVRMAPPLPWPEAFAGLAFLSGLWLLTTKLRSRKRLREREEIPLEKERIIGGSGPDCDIVIANPNISAKHLAVEKAPGQGAALTVKDLGGGVRVLRDGELHKVIARQQLQAGDAIIIGQDGDEFHFKVITKEGKPSLRVGKVSYRGDRLALKALVFLGFSAVTMALYLI